MWTVCDAAFAQGFWRGRALMLEREDGNWYVLTDQEFTHLIAQELPALLPAPAIAPWKRGFIFGWCMTWHYQPFLDEEEEARAASALRKRRKSMHSSLPKYPNALRSCIKQGGVIHSAQSPGRPLFQKARSTTGLRARVSFRMPSANN